MSKNKSCHSLISFPSLRMTTNNFGGGEIRTHVDLRSRDLQSLAIGHYATPPSQKKTILENICWQRDSNPQPSDYKSGALPIELHQQIGKNNFINKNKINQ